DQQRQPADEADQAGDQQRVARADHRLLGRAAQVLDRHVRHVVDLRLLRLLGGAAPAAARVLFLLLVVLVPDDAVGAALVVVVIVRFGGRGGFGRRFGGRGLLFGRRRGRDVGRLDAHDRVVAGVADRGEVGAALGALDLLALGDRLGRLQYRLAV